MKCLFSIAFFTMFVVLLKAQEKYDYNWFLASIPSQTVPNHGITRMNFLDGLAMEAIDSTDFDIDATNVSWSNYDGEFQYFSNGCVVVNKNYQVMENGDSINSGEFYDEYCDKSYISFQGAIILPDIIDDSRQYLYHIWLDDFDQWGGAAQRFLFTEIDLLFNNTQGKVINKNQLIIEDTLCNGQLTAVKHANGKDWWVIMPENSSNGYYKILQDESGPSVHGKQYIGTVQDGRDWGGQAVFSPDGRFYMRATAYSGMEVMEFDRCEGKLYNARHVDLPFEEWQLLGAAISPNSRYAYVSSAYALLQFDLWANDITSTMDTIGVYDGFQSNLPAVFFMMQLAPDGKIYMTTGNATNTMHIIHNPDEAGEACNFLQHDIFLPTIYSFAPPNFPNYRLGPAPPGYCDSVMVAVGEEKTVPDFELYPNPARHEVTVTWAGQSPPELLKIFNNLGTVVRTISIEKEGAMQTIDVSDFPSGIYFICPIAERVKVKPLKIIVQRE